MPYPRYYLTGNDCAVELHCPHSRCDQNGKPIGWYESVPVGLNPYPDVETVYTIRELIKLGDKHVKEVHGPSRRCFVCGTIMTFAGNTWYCTKCRSDRSM